MQINQFTVTVRKTTPEELKDGKEYLTSSMAEAVNTCVRWGIVHNIHRKRFVTGFRQMALEAGSLMHDVMACLNLFHIGFIRNCPDHMHVNAKILFGKERWEFIYNELTSKEKAPTVANVNAIERMVFACIQTSEFYDDPNDRNRTVANLEHCAIALVQYWLSALAELPIYIADANDPLTPIGVEQSLDVVFEARTLDGELIDDFRFIGLADIVYQNLETLFVKLGEYKTASSKNDAWRLAFDTRHQLTGYNGALLAYFDNVSLDTILIGSSIPVRTTQVPVEHFIVPRDEENIKQFVNSMLFTKSIIQEYKDKPLDTPMFTHSCNRYFRPCSLLDLCTASIEDQHVMFEQMEIAQEMSPSEMKALLRSQ